jgi:dTDP-4-amino-4,6-dideoxygalactose transaminase
MNDISAAYLWGQLEKVEEINQDRLCSWQSYYQGFKELEDKGYIELPTIPNNFTHNAHMFYIKVKDINTRTGLLEYLKENHILAVFHYVPLHSSPAGVKFGRFHNKDEYTTKESERILRLPMYYGLNLSDIEKIIYIIKRFFYETK